jgi:hypothetical protein
MIKSEKLSANLPPEPGEHAVVVGEKTGMAYQRHGGNWLPPGLNVGGLFGGLYNWTAILAREDSVTLVWEPAE